MAKRRSSKEIELLIDDFYESGMTIVQYAQEKKVNIQSLYKRVQKRKAPEKKKLEFVPIRVANENVNEIPNTFNTKEQIKIILKTKQGHLLKIPHTISIKWFANLLKELG